MKPVALTVSRTALVAVALAMAGAANAQAQELGRLFFTPEQRAALDARRKARVPDKPAAVPVTESPVTRVNGAVQRGGGKSTVWVNGEMIPEDAQADSARVAPRGTQSRKSLVRIHPLTVNAQSPNKDAAKQFLSFLYRPDNYRQLLQRALDVIPAYPFQ